MVLKVISFFNATYYIVIEIYFHTMFYHWLSAAFSTSQLFELRYKVFGNTMFVPVITGRQQKHTHQTNNNNIHRKKTIQANATSSHIRTNFEIPSPIGEF